MDLISKDEVLKKLQEYIKFTDKWYEHTANNYLKDLENDIKSIEGQEVVLCQNCKHLTPRNQLEVSIKRRLPEDLIGRCWKTGLYVKKNDFCKGGEE